MNEPRDNSGVVVAGFGSPHGDDQVGWRVAALVEGACGSTTRAVLVQDLTQFLTALDNCRTLIIVDACRTGGLPGTIWRSNWPDSRIVERHGNSTHAVGLTYALRMAEALGRLPQNLVVFGIETAQCSPLSAMSAELGRAAAELANVIVEDLREVAYA